MCFVKKQSTASPQLLGNTLDGDVVKEAAAAYTGTQLVALQHHALPIAAMLTPEDTNDFWCAPALGGMLGLLRGSAGLQCSRVNLIRRACGGRNNLLRPVARVAPPVRHRCGHHEAHHPPSRHFCLVQPSDTRVAAHGIQGLCVLDTCSSQSIKAFTKIRQTLP